MNTDLVLIDDDEDMEPVVIIDDDEDRPNLDKTNEQTVDTIDLDDEPVVEGKVSNNTKIKNKPSNKSEALFINSLKNNRLMDRIINRCLNMEYAIGMPRVINKTLLPLYRDADNRYKSSEHFSKLLKKTFKMLIKDPVHKFLHIKTLCEELKSGLRRKVPFVTLASKLKNNGAQTNYEEITSSSRSMPENAVENKPISKSILTHNQSSTNKITKRKVGRPKKLTTNTLVIKKPTRSTNKILKEKTDIIDLDNSDNESEGNLNNKDHKSDIIVIDDTETNDNRNDFIEVSKEGIQDDSNKENSETKENSNNTNNEMENEGNKMRDTEMDYEYMIPQNCINVTEFSTQNDDVETPSQNENVEEIVELLEQQIASYKQELDKLEEAEVTSNHPSFSPYFQSSILKQKIIMCYKQLCKLVGSSEDVVTRCKIRLHVAEGHPPGPAKKLEKFLNDSIECTGAIAFPDFDDVVNCVYDANKEDSLGWNASRVIHEAAALFRECGQALRKRRQKREYRDLMSLVRDKEFTDDPAERDPILKAKLEENKLRARIKEDEILERYVNMENSAHREIITDNISQPQSSTVEFSDSDKDSSDCSDGETETNPSLLTNITTANTNTICPLGNISTSNNNLVIPVTNSIVVSPTVINNPTNIMNNQFAAPITCSIVPLANFLMPSEITNLCETGLSTKANDSMNNNYSYIINPIRFVSTENSILDRLLESSGPNYVTLTHTAKDTQCEIGESSKSKEIIYANNSIVPAINTRILSSSETSECLESNVLINHDANSINTGEGLISEIIQDDCEVSSTNNCKIEPRGILIDQGKIRVPNHSSSVSDEPTTSTCDPNTLADVDVKTEIKNEPIDVQNMLNELGDNFVSAIFDIEDPFVVIEISSDEYSDDDDNYK